MYRNAEIQRERLPFARRLLIKPGFYQVEKMTSLSNTSCLIYKYFYILRTALMMVAVYPEVCTFLSFSY